MSLDPNKAIVLFLIIRNIGVDFGDFGDVFRGYGGKGLKEYADISI